MPILSCSSEHAREGAAIEGKIVFYSNRDDGKWGLYLYDGNKVKFLTAELGSSTWYPDGSKLLVAFTNNAATIDLAGAIEETIKFDIPVFFPDFLSDTSGFVVKGTEREKTSEGKTLSEIDNLYEYNFLNKTVHKITSFNEWGHIFSFDISPINAWIAFNWFPKNGQNEAFLLNYKTGEKIKFDDYVWNMQWAPDGKKLFYEKKISAKNMEEWKTNRGVLYSFDFTAKTSTLIHEPFASTGFRFSPDGKKILYSNWYKNGICLFILDLETKKVEQLLPLKQIKGEGTNDLYPDWHA